jgi:hypothetical protein
MSKRPLKWTRHEDLAINRRPSIRREEYLDYMTFQRNDRPLFTEVFGPIIGLKEEWEEQGATPEELDFSAFNYRCENFLFLPINTGCEGGFPEKIIEDNEKHTIIRDKLGRTTQLIKGSATLTLPLDFPVETMDDWLKIKPFYEFSESRFGEGWEEIAKKGLDNGDVICVWMPGGFDEPRQLMGEENLCVGYYEEPELIHDILNTIGKTTQKVLDRVSSKVTVDLLSVHEDMAGKSGALAGPTQVIEFIQPYYRRIWDMMKDRGVRLFDQDSDGDMNAVIPAFLDAGINLMHPMEPGSGMDIVKVREIYGNRLSFYGGLNKYVLRDSKEKIVEELEYKIPPMIKTGGCVLGLDHRVPNGTSLENYKFYMEKVWEIIERETA